MGTILGFIGHRGTPRDPVPQIMIPQPVPLRVGQLLQDRKDPGRLWSPGRIVEEIHTRKRCGGDIGEADPHQAAVIVVEELPGKRPVATSNSRS